MSYTIRIYIITYYYVNYIYIIVYIAYKKALIEYSGTENLPLYSFISKLYTKRILFTYKLIQKFILVLSNLHFFFPSYWCKVVKRGVFRPTWKFQKSWKKSKFDQRRRNIPFRPYHPLCKNTLFLPSKTALSKPEFC
jgi:hypothetical protein